eukprot:COSAG02_NODE_192_length_29942_cov_34.627228_4_plen_139_part_00
MSSPGGRRLRDAAERGDTVKVQKELAGGANVNDAVRGTLEPILCVFSAAPWLLLCYLSRLPAAAASFMVSTFTSPMDSRQPRPPTPPPAASSAAVGPGRPPPCCHRTENIGGRSSRGTRTATAVTARDRRVAEGMGVG